jgi:hypothetical protein
MRAVEVGKLNQLHLAGRMGGHLTLEDFELALQLWRCGSGE